MEAIDRLRHTIAQHTQTSLTEFLPRVDWSRDHIETFQTEKLRQTLGFAVKHSNWHRERLAHLDLEGLALQDLSSIPTMTKTDLMENFDNIVTDPHITRQRCENLVGNGDIVLDDSFVVITTGGTSGIRAFNVVQPSWFANVNAAVMRNVMRYIQRSGNIRMNGPPKTISIGSVPGPHGSYIAGSVLNSNAGAQLSVIDPIEKIVATLNRSDPDHIIVYASYLPRLIEETIAGRLSIQPKIVSPVAEPSFVEHEAQARELWGCAIIGGWAATEVGALGFGSGFEPGMLLCDDLSIIEAVDMNGLPVSTGTRCDKLYVTNLFTTVLPLIRYEIRDQITLSPEPAQCDSGFRHIESVSGRTDESFVYGENIKVHPHLFRTTLAKQTAVIEYQVKQTERGAKVSIVPVADRANDINFEFIKNELENNLSNLGLNKPIIDIEMTNSIARTSTGNKLRRFLPLPKTIK